LAALPPNPLDSGRPLRMVIATPRRSPSAVSSAWTATPAVLRAASRGSRPPSPTISSMSTWGSGPSLNRADTSSPGASRAKPRTSKPHATLETVAGANAVTTRSAMSVAMLHRRDEIVGERPVEVVRGTESPVEARRRVVHIGRPRIDDALPLFVDLVGDSCVGKGLEHDRADLRRRWVERAKVVS